MAKKCLAEFIGTAVLVTFGCGVAMTNGLGAGYVGIALAFGLVIVAMAYSIGNISGCHVNPAVSLAMLINGKLNFTEFGAYVISQFVGAVCGGLILYAIFGGQVATLGLGTNGFGELSAVNISMAGAFIAEVVLTFVFVLAICGVTSRESFSNVAGIVIGLALTLVHLMGLPLTGTSVNPARSFGAALVAMIVNANNGAEAFSQVWLFIIAPLIGGAIAAVVYKALDSKN
jgi:aquaporin Z